MRLVRSHDPAIISYRSLGLLVVDPRAELSTTYDGSDQSAVIICGVKKVIGCLIAQSYEREREREREKERLGLGPLARTIGGSSSKKIVDISLRRFLIYALAALHTTCN
mgnify:CR=1 FL=1